MVFSVPGAYTIKIVRYAVNNCSISTTYATEKCLIEYVLVYAICNLQMVKFHVILLRENIKIQELLKGVVMLDIKM